MLALVVQPGVQFDDDSVVDYSRAKAAKLSGWRQGWSGRFVFEAHSTDYQRPAAFIELVQDGFGILQVGPALTRLPEVVEQTMMADPASWKPYYEGRALEQKRLRVYSYSDRMRYYWNYAAI